MERIKVDLKIKVLHPDAVVPKYAKSGDAGLDLTAIGVSYDQVLGLWVYQTGLAFEIPEGYFGQIAPRSSITKYNLALANSIGIIDSGYRGEVLFKFRETAYAGKLTPTLYAAGDKIGQLIILPYPNVSIHVVEELSTTERGAGGYGSSGK